MYHMQRNEGDIVAHIDQAWSEIAYFQIGDNPGRKEPGTGEMNYQQHLPAHSAARVSTAYSAWSTATRTPARRASRR